jgi:osmotically-inducible protein OsmY
MFHDHDAIAPRGSRKAGAIMEGAKAHHVPSCTQDQQSQDQQSDDELAGRAVRCLQWSLRVPEGSVDVRVRDGWVTLTGTVEWRYQRLGAEAAVLSLSGVRGLTNLIRVRPQGDDADVRQKMIDLAWTWQRGRA